MTMADTVAVMNHGRIEQIGHPEALYDLPATRFVAGFLGKSNMGKAEVRRRQGDQVVVEFAGTTATVPAGRAPTDTDQLWFGIRPEKVRIVTDQSGGHRDDVRATVVDVSFTGVATEYIVKVPSGRSWTVYEQNMDVDPNPIRPGDTVWLEWDPAHSFAVPRLPDDPDQAGDEAELEAAS